MHVCLFDIDGTLVNTGGAGQAAMEIALNREFNISKETTGISTAGRTDRAIISDLFDFHNVENSEAMHEKFLAAYVAHLPEQLKQRDGVVLPGIVGLLNLLSERTDVLLGLLTGNFEQGADAKLSHYNIGHHFQFGGFGDRHHDRDDVARDALEKVHEQLNGSVAMEKVWVIGDTPADVTCGRAIGAQVVAVGTGFFPMEDLVAAKPDHLFESFADPNTLLDLLEA